MAPQENRKVQHEIKVAASAESVYRLVAEVENWPQVFPPTVHVEHEERGRTDERIRIWATANGEAKTWTSRRSLDPAGLRIEFRQEVSQPPVAAMGGAWVVEPVSDGHCLVRLFHDYRAVGDDPENLAWIDKAVDHNSNAELAALKAKAELAAASSDLLLSFEDTVDVQGSAADVYDFLDEAQLWSERLPHVARVSLREDTPGLQVLAMDTRTKDGSVHTTESIRVTFPRRKIVYKQIVLPALLDLHTGEWVLTENGDGVTVTSRHTVVINEANIEAVCGTRAGVAEAREFVQSALSGNSLATLGHAKRYAEGRR
ncbi:aromatase/cyclase [Amycolatopsis umgeniensis]|uniref:Aromatase n=1 Tax=Amycolatopsis umgeniensis TaxID=336628 RepID=A0A841BFB6_9PSEU|nr:aromatase/cyclase [Amycolatopsis umgeniensis]MBB5857498.1 aromatase [Amycolatopsis umgeniensis]